MPAAKRFPVARNGVSIGEVVCMPGQFPSRGWLACLPPYQSAGQKAHKAFHTRAAAEAWLERHASTALSNPPAPRLASPLD